MAVTIRLIEEGQTGKQVADNMKANFEDVVNEIEASTNYNSLAEKKSLEGQEYIPMYDGGSGSRKKASVASLSEVPPKGGWNRKLYEAAGAVYNEKSGFYELNGLTDITEGQMAAIYSDTNNMFSHPFSHGAYCGCRFRTNIAPNRRKHQYYASSSYYMLDGFRNNPYLELLVLHDFDEDILMTGADSFVAAFYSCENLTEIRGGLNVEKCTTFAYSFGECKKLKKCSLLNVKASISFSDSPLLTVDDYTDSTPSSEMSSLGYLVKRATNIKPITVTLHHDAYVRVPQSLKDKATAKQISIADASAQ